MNVTFLIGNGFDLNCGLKSSYRDVYNEYIKQPSKTPRIKKFKEDIWNDIDNWGDFELRMSNYLSTFNTENDFLECLRDFKSYLNTYLENEQSHFFDKLSNDRLSERASIEMSESINKFYTGITRNLEAEINSLRKNDSLHWNYYSYICFNYTNVLDRLIKSEEQSNIIHIHGRINQDIVLGMDNENQLTNHSFALTNRSKRAFIKPFFNFEFDRSRVILAENRIKQSDVICVYGMSLGESDNSWKKLLLKWLEEKENNHLFIYKRRYTKLVTPNYDERMDFEEEAKNELQELLGCNEAIMKKIHIPCGRNIFNIKKVIEEEQQKMIAEGKAIMERHKAQKEKNKKYIVS